MKQGKGFPSHKIRGKGLHWISPLSPRFKMILVIVLNSNQK